jgi:hypothetical protein
MDFLFIAEVRKQILNRCPVYDVFYALAANPESIDQLEIYRGSSPYRSVCWRQRFSAADTILADPDLVEIIGRAIKVQEDIESV